MSVVRVVLIGVYRMHVQMIARMPRPVLLIPCPK